MKRLLSLITVSAVSLLVPTMAFASGDKNCSDFKTWTEAQSYFESKGGSSSNNVDGLDRDHDGIACESLKGFKEGHKNPNDKPTTPPKENPKPNDPEQPIPLPTPQPEQKPAPNPQGNTPQQPGAPLPKTATSFGNMITLGAILISGGALLLHKNRQTS